MKSLVEECLLHTAVAVYTLFLFTPFFDRQGRLPKIALGPTPSEWPQPSPKEFNGLHYAKKWTGILTDDPSHRKEKPSSKKSQKY